jgi:FkbM family methyltransferase
LGHIDTLELVQLASPAGISVMYDIGANVGTWSLLAKALVPDARIEAFEPLPKHQAEFLRNFTGSADVTLHSVAVGSDNATGTFHVTDFSDASASCSRMRRSGRSSECARCSSFRFPWFGWTIIAGTGSFRGLT